MAYLQPSKLDEEQQAQMAGTAAPSLGSAPAAPAAASTAGSAPPPAPTSQPNGFPGITAYLDANRGSGSNMGQQIDRQVGSRFSQAQSDYAKGQQDWQAANQKAIDDWTAQAQQTISQNDAAQSAYDQAKNGPVLQQPEGGPQRPGQSQPKEPQVGFQRPAPARDVPPPILSDLPAMPTLSAYSPWAGGLQSGHDAQTELQQLGSDAGRQAVLQQMAASPDYTPGLAAFDAAVLGNANPTLGSDLSSKYAGILAALQSGVAPPTIPDPTKKKGS